MANIGGSFRGKRILAVGGAGFVGGNLVRMLLDGTEDLAVTVVDNLLSSERESLPEDNRLTFIEGSITSDGILAKLDDRFDFVFHLATYHGNQSSIHDPLADHEHNTLSTLKLFNHMRNFRRIEKMVYSSAGCAVAEKTFGEASPTTEDEPLSMDQDSPYSISKIIGEFYAVYFHRHCGLPTVRARFQNVYGPGEILGAGKWRGTPATVWRNVVPTFTWKALHDESLPVENEGRATRDFIFVEDICRGLIACALSGKGGEVYNLATGREVSIHDLAVLINEITGNGEGVELRPARGWDHSGKRLGSTAKARRELGFEARTGLREGLEATVTWTRNHRKLIAACIEKHASMMSRPTDR